MPMTGLQVEATRTADGVRVVLANPGPAIAFFARVEISGTADGDELVPVRWSDNYVTLLPGESRTLEARFDAPQGALIARSEGWNVAQAVVPVQ
jgi:exo-1,4-beta-D-glucosaminidase